jgi:hypothetical protein
MISDASDAADGSSQFPISHVMTAYTMDTDDGHPPHDVNRMSRLHSHPIRFGEYVVHLSIYPPVFITACCDLEQGKAEGDIIEQPNLAS